MSEQCSRQMLSNRVVEIQRSKDKFINYAFLRPLLRKMEQCCTTLNRPGPGD